MCQRLSFLLYAMLNPVRQRWDISADLILLGDMAASLFDEDDAVCVCVCVCV